MTKTDILDQIEFALSELADVQIELRRIQECPIDPPRPGQLHLEVAAFAVGRCQGMADTAQTYLSQAVENLRQCLSDPKKNIPAFFGSALASTRTSPDPAAQPPFNPKGDPA